MPIEVLGDVRAVDECTFADLCYQVMGRVFSVRQEMGPFFIERVYKNKICAQLGQTQHEVPVVVSHGDFQRKCFLDTVFDGIALFEWKAVDQLDSSHRAQLLNYLMLCELERGKLVNLRPATVEHEFVNSPLTRERRRSFEVCRDGFVPRGPTESSWIDFMLGALRDWGHGTGLASL